jgi:PhzF family phenazine biosynthesis protein
MKKYRGYQVDAFTGIRFAGNPAGVVPNADGLGERDMLAIARELNNSETAWFRLPKTVFSPSLSPGVNRNFTGA